MDDMHTMTAVSTHATTMYGSAPEAGPLIIVACTGNICRSPMAEAVLRHELERRHIRAQVRSCGLDAPIGRKPHPFAVEANTAHGIPIAADKRSAACNSADLRHAQAIFVMENHHRHQIMARYPFASGKTFLLGHWQNQQIADPVVSSRDVFDDVYAQIFAGSQAWITHLLQAGILPAPVNLSS